MRITRFLPLLLVCLAIPVRAQQNNQDPVRMVTYFPAPYVAYSTLNVDHSLQVGLKGNVSRKLVIGSADMNVSNNNNQILHFSSTAPAQDVGGIVVDHGSLNFQSGTAIRSVLINPAASVPTGMDPVMELGENPTPTPASFHATIHFMENLQVNTVLYGLQSFYTNDLQVNALNLFGLGFPSCREINGTGEMKWESLKLSPNENQAKKLYLTCVLSNSCTPGATSTETKLCHQVDPDQCGGQLTRSVTCNENGVWEGGDWDTSSCTPRPAWNDSNMPSQVNCSCRNHVDLPPGTTLDEVFGVGSDAGTVFHNREIECLQNSSGNYEWQVANTNDGHNGWGPWWEFSEPTVIDGVTTYPCLGWQAVEDIVDWQSNNILVTWDGCMVDQSGQWPRLGYDWPLQYCTAVGNERVKLVNQENWLFFGFKCTYRRYRCVHLHVKPWEPLSC